MSEKEKRDRERMPTNKNKFDLLHTNRVENISGGAIKDKIGNVKLCFYYSEIKLQKKIKSSLAMNVKIL